LCWIQKASHCFNARLHKELEYVQVTGDIEFDCIGMDHPKND